MKKTILRRLDGIFSKFARLKYGKNEMILKSGQNPPGIYYLRQGYVRQYAQSPHGEELVIHVYRPGAFFPMTWAVNSTPNTFYFETMSPVELNLVPVKEVRMLLKQQPDILFDFTRRLLLGVSGLLSRLEDLILDNAHTRVAALLSYFANKFGVKQDNDIIIPVSLTHRDIASWVGVTRETASLQVEALKKKGILAYRGRTIVVKDFNKLQDEARER